MRISDWSSDVCSSDLPKHRDRIAFMRLASGHFRRGMKMHHVRSGKTMSIHNPVLFLAQYRPLAEEAWAGDTTRWPKPGHDRPGYSLAERKDLRFTGIPTFDRVLPASQGVVEGKSSAGRQAI